MSNKTATNLAVLIILGMVVQLGVIGYVWYSNYQARGNTVKAQRAGCERSKLDRAATVVLSENILDNFQETDRLRGYTTPQRKKAQKEIQRQIDGLKVRASIVCSEAFKKASLIP